MIIKSEGASVMKVDTILVPVDGSEGSLLAIDTAKAIAQKFDSKIVLIHVVDVGTRGTMHEFYSYDPVVEEALIKRGEKLLDKEALKFEGMKVEKISLKVQAGDGIVTYADENPVDLIVMATRGMTRVRRFFVGSVTNYVVHHSKVPVLAIPVE